MNKRAAMDEGLMMIYRLLLISFIAFIVLGISSVFYAHYIDVRDAEARILAREVINCISPSAVLNLDSLVDEDYSTLLKYCGYDDSLTERFYVELDLKYGVEEVKLYQGDSGALWVLNIFDSEKLSEGLKKYQPGYYDTNYSVYVISGGKKIGGEASLKVLVRDEF